MRHRDIHPTAGGIYGKSTPSYHKLRDEQKQKNQDATEPFADEDEFQLVKWFTEEGISQGGREKFLKLNIVSILDAIKLFTSSTSSDNFE